MKTKLALAAVLLLGCMAPLPAENTTATAGDDILPPATRTLVVPGDAENDPSLLDLLEEFADCTGQKLLMTREAVTHLRGIQVSLLTGTQVPVEEVYPFVESILAHHYAFITPAKGGKVPMLTVHALQAGGRSGSPHKSWTKVTPEDLPKYKDHPALLILTTVHLPNTEVRQISTSMRTMFTDQNTQNMIAVGDHSVLLMGPGRMVAEMAEMLLLIDEASAVRVEETGEVPGPQPPQRTR